MKCNKCGEKLTEFSDYLYVEKQWGYYSDKDLELHKFRLCQKCYDEMVKGFKIPITIKDYDISELRFRNKEEKCENKVELGTVECGTN